MLLDASCNNSRVGLTVCHLDSRNVVNLSVKEMASVEVVVVVAAAAIMVVVVVEGVVAVAREVEGHLCHHRSWALGGSEWF